MVARTGALFVPAAAVGTVGHELGHWLAAWMQGCEPVLHFAWVSPHCSPLLPERVEWLGIAAGPVSTLMCGTAGMVGLHRWRRTADELDFKGVAWTVLTLFWSRPLFNTLVQLGVVGLGLVSPERLLQSDEGRMSAAMGLPTMTMSVVCSLLALGVIVWTTRQVPAAVRGAWAAGALSGALVGFALWMGALGPAWLP